MNFKNLFIGGLCVSAVFAACTKEISVEPSFEGNKAAIALGEGVTITGSKLGADTRAEYTDGFTGAVWNDGDMLGAAWYDMVTGIDEKTGKVTGHSSFKSFMSNTWFEKITEGTVATADFQTTANLMAGAYVLYFPYNHDWTDVKNEIPVKVSTEQTMDITPGKENAHLNKELFAYNTYKAVPGGAQLAEHFQLNQLTNALGIKFMVTKPELMLLEKPVTIKKIIIESNAFYSEGVITPSSTDVDYTKALPAAQYKNNKEANTIVLNIEGEAEGYKITKLNEETKVFYASVLPWEQTSNIVVRILATKEGEDKEVVYKGGPSTAALKNFNNYAHTDSNGEIHEGVHFVLPIVLDKLEETGEIYTEDQFKAKWAEANKAGQTKKQTLTVKTDINLPDFDLDPVVADISIDSEGEVVVGNVNVTTGSLAVNDLTVKGNLNVDGGLNVNGALVVKGDFEIGPDAKIVTNVNSTIAIDGKTRVVGKADASSLNIVKIGELEVTTTGNFSVDGSKLEEGKGELSKVTNRGELTLASVDLTGTLDNTGTVIADTLVVNFGTINNNGTITGTGLSKPLINYGIVNQNKEVMSKPFLYIDNLVDEKEGYKGSIHVNKDYWIGGKNEGEIIVASGVTLKLGSAYQGSGVINALGTSSTNKVTVDAGTAKAFEGTIVANKYTTINDNASKVIKNAKGVAFVVNKNDDLTNQSLDMISTLRVYATDYEYTTAHNSIVLELYGAKVTVLSKWGKINRYAKTIVKSNSEIITTNNFNFSGSDSSIQYGIVEENAVLTLNGASFNGTIKVKSASNVAFGKDVTNNTTLVLY